MKKLILTLTLATLAAACAENKGTPLHSSETGLFGLFQTAPKNLITVTSWDDQPLANAQILIGSELGQPFANNLITTDQNGQAALPSEWTSEAPVTVDAPGYVRVTYFNQWPSSLQFKLKRKSLPQQLEIKGKATQLPVAEKDGWVDFGLVMPAFSRADLLAFNVNSVISPQSDNLTVMGFKFPLPSNISLPRQSEKYSLLTVTLDKPNYRIYFGTSGVQRVYAARGKFPFKSTVDQIRDGKDYFDLINSFNITGGVIRDALPKSPLSFLDLPMNELNYSGKAQIKAPPVGADEIFVSMGISENSGYMIPTDIKRLNSNATQTLNTLAGSPTYVLGAVMKMHDLKNEVDRMSAALLPASGVVAPQLLPLIPSPSIARNILNLPTVNPISGVQVLGVFSLLSFEEEIQQAGAPMRVLNPQWEVFAKDWPQSLEMPIFPGDNSHSGKKRWEVNFIGSQNTSQMTLGPAMIEAATHVTHSSVTF